jgi:hypothetical protein
LWHHCCCCCTVIDILPLLLLWRPARLDCAALACFQGHAILASVTSCSCWGSWQYCCLLLLLLRAAQHQLS